jgi:hypothetical protein
MLHLVIPKKEEAKQKPPRQFKLLSLKIDFSKKLPEGNFF